MIYIYTVIISIIILLAAVLMLGLRVFFVKGGKFPNIHIGGIKALKDKGVNCATTQDREARKKSKKMNTSNMINEITENY